MNTPLLFIVPALAVHVTVCAGLLVPDTVTINVCCAPPDRLAVDGETDTLETVGVCVKAGTVTVAVPLLPVSTVLVAVTVIICAELVAAGAVNRPVEALMLPALVVQVTVCAGLLVPITLALNCCVDPPATEGVNGETVTIVTVAVTVPMVALNGDV